jgi:hypothetical protein
VAHCCPPMTTIGSLSVSERIGEMRQVCPRSGVKLPMLV